MAIDEPDVKERAPDPDDPRKPESPTDLTKPSVFYVLRKTAREFQHDQCTDLAAALTYYAVLSLFPAVLVVVSLLGVFGQGRNTTDAVLDIVSDMAPPSTVDTLRPTIQQLVESPSAGIALVLGILTALWSASGYVGAFGRAMNRIYEIDEGRPVWKLRPLQLALTLAGLIMAAAVAFMLAVSGPVARAIGNAIGLGDVALTLWNILRWPVILVLVVQWLSRSCTTRHRMSSSPNSGGPVWVRHWRSWSGYWLPSVFGVYVANFGSYNKTYGALAGVIIFLLWLWITNLALLFGAELDSELERGRQLQAGMPAEKELQLPPRDTRVSDKYEAAAEKDVERARRLRQSRGQDA